MWNPPFPALLARDSVAGAEHGNDGLFPLAGKWKIVIANGTAIFMTHRAQYETTRDVFRRSNCQGRSDACGWADEPVVWNWTSSCKISFLAVFD